MAYNNFKVHQTGQGFSFLPRLLTPTCPACGLTFETRSPLQRICPTCKKLPKQALQKLIAERRSQ
jgi:protein-arginine kinase activator protein McsA